MTMRALLYVGGTLACVLIGALLAAVILTAITIDEHGQRIDATRDRLVQDEQAVCATLRASPDNQQSLQIAALARAAGDRTIASDAAASVIVVRIPPRCTR